MADNPQVRAIHESGAKHKENVARRLRRLRELRRKAEEEKESTAKALDVIEQQAQRQYEADVAAQDRAKKEKYGTWVSVTEGGGPYHMCDWLECKPYSGSS